MENGSNLHVFRDYIHTSADFPRSVSRTTKGDGNVYRSMKLVRSMTPTIRLATERDAGAVAGIYAPVVEGTHVSFETVPPSPGEMADRIRTRVERLPWLVCEHGGDIVGYANASPHSSRAAYQWSVDTSVYVAEGWRNEGVARGLYESLFELLRLQGIYTAYAVIALPNPASVGLHESFGFERVGLYERVGFKNGDWHDVGHWELALQPREESPSPPTPIDELRETDGFRAAVGTGESSLRL
jgi:phosphinothricin acetyltransferase